MKRCDNCSLLPYNTFGIDATARCLYIIESVADVATLCDEHSLSAENSLAVGEGSNMLFSQHIGLTLLHSAIKGISVVAEQDDDVLVSVGSGEVWDEFVAFSVAHGWYGLENLSLIPGQVGAAAVQNIGAYGAEAKDFIEDVSAIEVSSGKQRVFTNAECQYAYRKSVFKTKLARQYFITAVKFRLRKTFKPNVEYGSIKSIVEKHGKSLDAATLRAAIIDVRRQKLPDPKEIGNAGSFFMNPVISSSLYEKLKAKYPEMPSYKVHYNYKIPAAWLIEKSGWKGRSLGRAADYARQALVLVNLGGATSDDIVNLSRAIRNDVETKFGIELKPEVLFV